MVEAAGSGEIGYSMVSQMRRKNGDYIWVRMTARFTNEYINGYQVSYTAMTDVSDIMQMRLEQSVTYDNLPGFVAKYRVGKDLTLSLIHISNTILSFLSRLEEKGFVKVEKKGKINWYTPIVEEKKYLQAESKSILATLYGNSMKNFVTALYDGKAVNQEQIRELKEFLDELDRK